MPRCARWYLTDQLWALCIPKGLGQMSAHANELALAWFLASDGWCGPDGRRPTVRWVRWSAVGVLGMSRRGVDQPDGAFVVIDGVADAAAAGYLVLPLFHVTAVVPVPCQVASEPVLAVMVRPGPRVGAQDLQAATGIRQRVAAQLLPAGRRVAGAEPDIPLAFRRRAGEPVTAPRAHAMTSAGPKSPSVGASARAYCPLSALIRAVARHPAITSCAFWSMVSSAASASAAISSAVTSVRSAADR